MSREEDLVVLVDENDNELGHETKGKSHTVHDEIPGYHHRGLTVLVYNGRGEVLLQHRKHSIFDKVWDLAGSTHPYFRNGVQEGYEEAAERCMRTEYAGLERLKVSRSTIAVNYASVDPLNPRSCENEFCRLMVALHDGDPKHKSEAAYGLRWIPYSSLVSEVKAGSNYAPWVIDLLGSIEEKRPKELSRLF